MDAEAAALGRSMSERTQGVGKSLIRRIGALVAVLVLLAGCSGKESGEADKPSRTTESGRRDAGTGPRDRERGLHLRLPDGRQLPGAVRLLRRQGGPRVQGRLERDPQHRAGVHAARTRRSRRRTRTPPTRRSAPTCVPNRWCSPSRRSSRTGTTRCSSSTATPTTSPTSAAAPPATAAASTCWPGRTGRATSPRASTRSFAPTPTWPSCCTARSCSGRPNSTTSRRSRPATRSRRCRCF